MSTRSLLRVELRRVRRDPVLVFFVAVLPLVCYLGFGLALPPGPPGGSGCAAAARRA